MNTDLLPESDNHDEWPTTIFKELYDSFASLPLAELINTCNTLTDTQLYTMSYRHIDTLLRRLAGHPCSRIFNITMMRGLVTQVVTAMKTCLCDNGEPIYTLVNNAEISFGFSFGGTPLSRACHDANIDACKYFLSVGADPNKVDTDSHKYAPPIMMACYMKRNQDSDATSQQEFTRCEIIRLLLDHGATIAPSYSCLLQADRSPSIARLLIAHGASLNVVDSDGNTPLHAACLRYDNYNPGPSCDIIDALIDAGANLEARNKAGYTAATLVFHCSDKNAKSILRRFPNTQRELSYNGVGNLVARAYRHNVVSHADMTPMDAAILLDDPDVLCHIIQLGEYPPWECIGLSETARCSALIKTAKTPWSIHTHGARLCNATMLEHIKILALVATCTTIHMPAEMWSLLYSYCPAEYNRASALDADRDAVQSLDIFINMRIVRRTAFRFQVAI